MVLLTQRSYSSIFFRDVTELNDDDDGDVGKRAFPISSATVWNDLPLHVASAPSLAVFRQRLNTFLFSRSYQDTVISLVCYYYHSSLLSGHLWWSLR